jgi:small subunit ribosomal protein S8
MMAVTDPIADMLTMVRNASSAKKEVVEVKNSRLTEEIIKIFKKERFISNYKIIKNSKQGILRIYLQYLKDGKPAILGIKKISKSGLRVYKKADDLPQVLGGLGTAVISTSKGLLTDVQARGNKVGGEVICYIW